MRPLVHTCFKFSVDIGKTCAIYRCRLDVVSVNMLSTVGKENTPYNGQTNTQDLLFLYTRSSSYIMNNHRRGMKPFVDNCAMLYR